MKVLLAIETMIMKAQDGICEKPQMTHPIGTFWEMLARSVAVNADGHTKPAFARGLSKGWKKPS